MHAELKKSVRFLKGIGEERAKKLAKLDIHTLFDLISYFPRDYEDRTIMKTISELHPGESACVKAIVATEPRNRNIRRGLDITKLRIVDETGGIEVTFFNQKFSATALQAGEEYVFYGKASLDDKRRIILNNPEYEKVGEALKTGRIVPIYPLTAGISRNMLSAHIRSALSVGLNLLIDPIPEKYREKFSLAHQVFSYRNIHYPENSTLLRAAQNRLVFEELLVFALGLGLLKNRRVPLCGIAMQNVGIDEFYATLPFKLTGAQSRAIDDAIGDMCKETPMNRLVQGDVGSGKTMVAAACAYFAIKNGHQAAPMVPTEILAEQHF